MLPYTRQSALTSFYKPNIMHGMFHSFEGPMRKESFHCYPWEAEQRNMSAWLVLGVKKGSLRNDDSDSNGNGKKVMGYISKTTWHVHHAFFVKFVAVVTRLQRESAYFHVLSRTGTQDNNFLFLFPNFVTVFQKSTTKKNCPHMTS